MIFILSRLSLLNLALHPQHYDLGGMIERRGVSHKLPHARFRVAGEIFGDRDDAFHAQVTVRAQLFQHPHIRFPAQEQRVVDRHQPAAIRDQRAHLVDQAFAIRKVNVPLSVDAKKGGSRKTQSKSAPVRFRRLTTGKKSPLMKSFLWIGNPFSV